MATLWMMAALRWRQLTLLLLEIRNGCHTSTDTRRNCAHTHTIADTYAHYRRLGRGQPHKTKSTHTTFFDVVATADHIEGGSWESTAGQALESAFADGAPTPPPLGPCTRVRSTSSA